MEYTLVIFVNSNGRLSTHEWSLSEGQGKKNVPKVPSKKNLVDLTLFTVLLTLTIAPYITYRRARSTDEFVFTEGGHLQLKFEAEDH